MGRVVIADEALQDKLTALAKAGRFQIGLLIGQNTSERDIIVHLAPTPVPDEGDLSSEDEDNIGEDNTQGNRSKYPDSIPKVVDGIVAQHARQVVRMLPGGLDIIGIYVVTPQNDFTASLSQSKLRSVLNGVHKTASRILLDTTELNTDKVILHVCTQSFKILCKTQDVAEVSSQGNGDLKFQRGGVRWQQLTYTYNINLNFWLPKEKSAQSLYKTILTLLRPWAKGVTESLILIDSELPDDGDALDTSPPEDIKLPKKKGGGQALMPPKVFSAEILDSMAPVGKAPLGNGVFESGGCVRLSGCLAGCAFVHSKATVGESRQAVICDLVRSVVGRWEMHCDSLVEEPPSHINAPIIHEPPRRVFIEGGGLPISLCDYLFPGDTVSDACQSAKELLGLRIRKEHVDESQETLAEPSDVMEYNKDPDELCSSQTVHNTGGNGREGVCSPTHILLAAVIALVGIGISYITLMGTKTLT